MYPAIPFGPCGIAAGMGIYGGRSHHTDDMETTITIELTQSELQDLRIALIEYRSKWFDLIHKGLRGEMPSDFSVEGAGFVYDDIRRLQDRLQVLSVA